MDIADTRNTEHCIRSALIPLRHRQTIADKDDSNSFVGHQWEHQR
jgi:hypothetical protein